MCLFNSAASEPTSALASELIQTAPNTATGTSIARSTRLLYRYTKLPIPPGMVVPPTLTIHRVIEATAKRIASTPQLELLLRMRGDNNFSFLAEPHPLHPFFLYLKDRVAAGQCMDWPPPEEVEVRDVSVTSIPSDASQDEAGPVIEENAQAVSHEAVNPLGITYGDTDDNGSSGDDPNDGSAVVARVSPIVSLGSSDPAPQLRQVPPEGILSYMERLLAYVRRNGARFLTLVTQRHKDDPNFAFLHPWSSYNPYWDARVTQLLQEVYYNHFEIC
jgi:hypothetical protein